ncbi:MAG: hypothetical protein Q9227_009386 [Pyrenula ochraceoflavens]
MPKQSSHIYSPQDAADSYQSWHQCPVTGKATDGKATQCKACRNRFIERRLNKGLGSLYQLPPEVRAMIFGYLVPPEKLLPTIFYFSPFKQSKIRDQKNKHAMRRNTSNYHLERKAKRKNVLNIMAVSRAVCLEFKNLPSYRKRMFTAILCPEGFAFENSLPGIDVLTDLPENFTLKAKSLRSSFRHLHYIKPRRLQVSCPLHIRFTPGGKLLNLSEHLVVYGIKHLCNTLVHSPDMTIQELRIYLLLRTEKEDFDPDIGTCMVQSFDDKLVTAFTPLFSHGKPISKMVNMHIKCNKGQNNKRPRWLAGLDILLAGISRMAEAGRLNWIECFRIREKLDIDLQYPESIDDPELALIRSLCSKRLQVARCAMLGPENE